MAVEKRVAIDVGCKRGSDRSKATRSSEVPAAADGRTGRQLLISLDSAARFESAKKPARAANAKEVGKARVNVAHERHGGGW